LGRREVLAAGGGTALGLLVVLAGCGGDSGDDAEPLEPMVGDVDAGTASDYALGTIRRIEQGPIFVARDELGLYAMSAMCTHLGCTVDIGSDRLPCPCHGSEFDFEGNVLEGPATDPLRHYAVYVAGDGRVRVATDEPVDPSSRTAV
jgi:cytochrome b6-f complex iron-sulfur subunit